MQLLKAILVQLGLQVIHAIIIKILIIVWEDCQQMIIVITMIPIFVREKLLQQTNALTMGTKMKIIVLREIKTEIYVMKE